jgi:hypothetical protein
MAEISILLNKETIFANGECRKNFNDTVRFLVEHYSNVRLASKKNGNCQKKFCQILLNFYSLKRPFRI